MSAKGKAVWKYPLEITNYQMIPMPIGVEFLHVGLDPEGNPSIWVLVTPGNPMQGQQIIIYGTGHPVMSVIDKKDNYIGTFNHGQFVWHVFA